jgi:hypothetical protein
MSATWTLAGTGDFDGDARCFDFLWLHPTSGSVMVALNDGATQKAFGNAGAVSNTWRVASVADFDGDGKSDVLWIDPATNTATIWLMDRLNVKSIRVVGSLGAGWSVAATGDFDGDRKADVLFELAGSSELVIWLLDGATVRQSVTTALLPGPGWVVAAAGDFNGDGKADIVASAPTVGLVWILAGNGAGFVPTSLLVGATSSTQLVATGDYDADGNDDLLLYESSWGAVSTWLVDLYGFKSSTTLGVMDSSWTVVGEMNPRSFNHWSRSMKAGGVPYTLNEPGVAKALLRITRY